MYKCTIFRASIYEFSKIHKFLNDQIISVFLFRDNHKNTHFLTLISQNTHFFYPKANIPTKIVRFLFFFCEFVDKTRKKWLFYFQWKFAKNLKDIMKNHKPQYQIIGQDTNASTGGLAIIWNPGEIWFEERVSIPWILSRRFRVNGSNDWVLLTRVYGPHIPIEVRAFL